MAQKKIQNTQVDFIIDEDTMSSNSDTVVPTQQSVKTYVDAQIISSGAGDVVGPASATDNALVRFDSTTGKLVQNSGVTVDDSDVLTVPDEIDIATHQIYDFAGELNFTGSGGIAFEASTGDLTMQSTSGNVSINGGAATFNSQPLATTTGTQSLTNKNLTSGTNTFPTFNQNTTGSAATLTTPRAVQTNLASTSSASFDGSANITPGVTGTLPVANGGTGTTTSTGSGNTVLSSAPTLTSPVLDTSVSGTAVLDEDDMVSDSSTKLATQQSIKAYVDTSLSKAPNSYVEGVPLYSIGHSYTIYPYPYGTQYTGEHALRIKDRLKLGDISFHGRSGTYAADNFGRLISSSYDSGSGLWTPDSKGIVLLQNAMNELGNSTYAGDTTFRNLWAQSIRGEIAVASSESILGYAARSASSGTWTSHAVSYANKGIDGAVYFATATSGAYLEWTVPQGDEVWVVGVVSKSTYTVADLIASCSGTDLVTFSGNNKRSDYLDAVTGVAENYTPWAFKVTGLNAAAGTSGSKTIRVRTSGASGNSFVTGVIIPSPNPPYIFLAKEPPRVGSAQATYDANISHYNSTTDTIAGEFDNVFAVDLSTNFDTNTMVASLDPSSFHPNDVGQSKIADNYVTGINTNITSWVDGVAIL